MSCPQKTGLGGVAAVVRKVRMQGWRVATWGACGGTDGRGTLGSGGLGGGAGGCGGVCRLRSRARVKPSGAPSGWGQWGNHSLSRERRPHSYGPFSHMIYCCGRLTRGADHGYRQTDRQTDADTAIYTEHSGCRPPLSTCRPRAAPPQPWAPRTPHRRWPHGGHSTTSRGPGHRLHVASGFWRPGPLQGDARVQGAAWLPSVCGAANVRTNGNWHVTDGSSEPALPPEDGSRFTGRHDLKRPFPNMDGAAAGGTRAEERKPQRRLPPQVPGPQATHRGRLAGSGPGGEGHTPLPPGAGDLQRGGRDCARPTMGRGGGSVHRPPLCFCPLEGSTERPHHIHWDPGQVLRTRGAWCGDTWWPHFIAFCGFPRAPSTQFGNLRHVALLAGAKQNTQEVPSPGLSAAAVATCLVRTRGTARPALRGSRRGWRWEGAGSAQTEHGRTASTCRKGHGSTLRGHRDKQTASPLLVAKEGRTEPGGGGSVRSSESRSPAAGRSLPARGALLAGVSPALRRPSGPPARRLHQEPVAKLGRKQVSSEAKQGATWLQAAPAADPTSSRRRHAAQEAQV